MLVVKYYFKIVLEFRRKNSEYRSSWRDGMQAETGGISGEFIAKSEKL